MTPQKAIDFIRGLNIAWSWAYEKDENEAIDMAIDLLEKQIEKKPNRMSNNILRSDGWEYACPSCNCAVGENVYSKDYTQEDDYCPTCGQKIDWT